LEEKNEGTGKYTVIKFNMDDDYKVEEENP